jgi:hypothetical protein
MIGTNAERDIVWADIMSQADDADVLLVNMRDQLLLEMAAGKNGYSGKLTDKDLLKYVQWLGVAVKAGFTKPDFGQYNYIQVSPSLFAVILTYIIVVIVNVGAGFFVVINPWQEGAPSSRRRNGYRFR